MSDIDEGFRERLVGFRSSITAEDRKTAAWPIVERMLAELGDALPAE